MGTLGIGAFSLYNTISHLIETQRKPRRAWGVGSLACCFAVPTLCFGTLLIIAVSVLMGWTNGPIWLISLEEYDNKSKLSS